MDLTTCDEYGNPWDFNNDVVRAIESGVRNRQSQHRRDQHQPCQAESRHERERIAGPPPQRDDYGPRGITHFDESFRADRATWYESFTGESIADRSLQEQNELCDSIARRFRAYTDSRARTNGSVNA